MRLTSIAMLGIGYVLGARAGRERYDQISDFIQRTSKRLENR